MANKVAIAVALFGFMALATLANGKLWTVLNIVAS